MKLTLEIEKGILAAEDDPGDYLIIFYEDNEGKTQSIDIPLAIITCWEED